MPHDTDTRTRGAAAEATALSEHCELAGRPGYEDLHHDCRRDADYTLPGSPGIVVTPRCGCGCHRKVPR